MQVQLKAIQVQEYQTKVTGTIIWNFAVQISLFGPQRIDIQEVLSPSGPSDLLDLVLRIEVVWPWHNADWIIVIIIIAGWSSPIKLCSAANSTPFLVTECTSCTARGRGCIALVIEFHCGITHWATYDLGTYAKPLVVRKLPRTLVTFETFDQCETWPDQKRTMTKTNTKKKTMTKTNTFREHLQRATLETWDLWDIWSEWWGDMT